MILNLELKAEGNTASHSDRVKSPCVRMHYMQACVVTWVAELMEECVFGDLGFTLGIFL